MKLRILLIIIGGLVARVDMRANARRTGESLNTGNSSKVFLKHEKKN